MFPEICSICVPAPFVYLLHLLYLLCSCEEFGAYLLSPLSLGHSCICWIHVQCLRAFIHKHFPANLACPYMSAASCQRPEDAIQLLCAVRGKCISGTPKRCVCNCLACKLCSAHTHHFLPPTDCRSLCAMHFALLLAMAGTAACNDNRHLARVPWSRADFTLSACKLQAAVCVAESQAA